eukprot:1161602-Pelagomonas_calceolata.AAC.2
MARSLLHSRLRPGFGFAQLSLALTLAHMGLFVTMVVVMPSASFSCQRRCKATDPLRCLGGKVRIFSGAFVCFEREDESPTHRSTCGALEARYASGRGQQL